MGLKDIWEDLEDATEGIAGSGDDITVAPINQLAAAVIKNEEDIENLKTQGDNGGDSSIPYIDLGEIDTWTDFVDINYPTPIYFPTWETLMSAINSTEGVYHIKWDSMDGTQLGILIYDSYYASQRMTMYCGGNVIVSEELWDDINNEPYYNWKQLYDIRGLEKKIGNIDSALDELHNYAQALISGGVS